MYIITNDYSILPCIISYLQLIYLFFIDNIEFGLTFCNKLSGQFFSKSLRLSALPLLDFFWIWGSKTLKAVGSLIN